MSGPDGNATESNSVIWPELWSAFEPHRRRIFECIQSAATGPGKTLCIWGAGRTTDLDLIALVDQYSSIDLVDIHPTITQQALVQRGFDEHPQVRVVSGFDLTGLGKAWEKLLRAPTNQTLNSIVESANNNTLDLPQYDVVVSTCVMSQIIQHSTSALTDLNLSESELNAVMSNLIKALRDQHMRLLLSHVKPGGCAILITDLTSSAALPAVGTPNPDLDQLMELVKAGNHFHGLNPKAIAQSTKHPAIASQLEKFRVSRPWIWNSLEMQYLCTACQLLKKE